jgi:hypothetical protein
MSKGRYAKLRQQLAQILHELGEHAVKQNPFEKILHPLLKAAHEALWHLAIEEAEANDDSERAENTDAVPLEQKPDWVYFLSFWEHEGKKHRIGIPREHATYLVKRDGQERFRSLIEGIYRHCVNNRREGYNDYAAAYETYKERQDERKGKESNLERGKRLIDKYRTEEVLKQQSNTKRIEE